MKRKKIACLLLAGTMLLSVMPTQAFAATKDSTAGSNTVTTDGSQACEVDATIASTFSVTVPKKITLGGISKSGTYTVSCKGDIAGNESVSVVPDATFEMSQSGKANVQAAVTQEKTTFRDSGYTGDLGNAVKMGTAAGESTGTPIDGSIAAPGLSAGAWSGAFNFTIGLKEVLDPVTLTGKNLTNYVDAETGEAIATSGDVVIPAVVKNKDTGKEYQVTAVSGVIPTSRDDSPSNLFGKIAVNTGAAVNSVTLPDSVTSIGDGTFFGCSGLTSVNIPSDVTNIGVYAFASCGSLTSVNIPKNVENIGNWAFSDCSGLKNINISDGVKTIGEYAFSGCNALTEITIPSSVEDVGGHAFENINGLTTINISDGVKSIGEYAFHSARAVTSLKIPDSVTKVGEDAFGACSKLQTVSISKNLTDIPESMFCGCEKLTSVEIPSGVTSIGSAAFSDTGLTSINIPEGVVSIENNAFYRCENLTSVSIPDSVTKIGEFAFQSCNNLTSITIPDDISVIELATFSGCTSLSHINIPDNVTSIKNQAFVDCTNLSSITYKDQTYTSKSALIQVLTEQNVSIEDESFKNTALTD